MSSTWIDDDDVRSYGIILKRIGELFSLLNIYESIEGDSSAVEELYEAAASIDEDLAIGMYNTYLSVSPIRSTFKRGEYHLTISEISKKVDDIFVRLSVASVPTSTDRRLLGHLAEFYSMICNDKYIEIVKDIDNPLEI